MVVSGSVTSLHLGILSEEDRSTGRGRLEVVAAHMCQLDDLLFIERFFNRYKSYTFHKTISLCFVIKVIMFCYHVDIAYI